MKPKSFDPQTTKVTIDEFFLNNTNLTFQYKIDIKGFQNQQKIKLHEAGIELTTPTIHGLEFYWLTHSAIQGTVE